MVTSQSPKRCTMCRQRGHRIDMCPHNPYGTVEHAPAVPVLTMPGRGIVRITDANDAHAAAAAEEAERVEELNTDVARIAELREQCDALAQEISEYEQVLATVQNRIAENRARIVDKTTAIARLRAKVRRG